MKPVLYTVLGTGAPDPFTPGGFSGDVGRAFMFDPWADLAAKISGVVYDTGVYWQPIGNYPAAVFPMAASVDKGRKELHRQIALRPKGTPIFASGYSQGAIVVAAVWKDMLTPGGPNHDRLSDVRGIIQFGDPTRCPGIANGNNVAGVPAPTRLDGQTTGGIAGPGDLTPEQTPDFYLSCALDGDLYACCPVGDTPWDTPKRGGGENESQVGQIETRIYDFIMSGSLVKGFLAICEGIAEEFTMPVSATIAHFQAIANGLEFATKGMAASHWQYGPFVAPMVDWVRAQL